MNSTQAYRGNSTEASRLLPGEILHYTERKHWFVLVTPFLFLSLFLVLSTGLTFALTFLLQISSALLLLATIFIFLITLSLATKITIDWMFNFYVITSHKISETRINPLFADSISEILLKQVRCTEIDIVNHGIINQLLNKGNVHITFDRPTHRDEFVLSDISNPREIGMYLSSLLLEPKPFTNNVWFRDKMSGGKYRFSEDIDLRGGEVV